MKRTELEQHLRRHGCEFDREGGKHGIWRNLRTKAEIAMPRHSEINLYTARGLCKHLGVPKPTFRS